MQLHKFPTVETQCTCGSLVEQTQHWLRLVCMAMLSMSCIPWQTAVAQSFAEDGFRLFKNDDNQVVAATYHSERGIMHLIHRGRADWHDFIEPARLSKYPNLESVKYDYGHVLTAEHLSYIGAQQNLKEIELGFVGVNSEYVTIQGDMLTLGRLKRLERIHLSKEKMIDADLQFIASLPKIKHLAFNANTTPWEKEGPRCTDRCADYLKQATTLETLWVHDATDLTDEFVSKLTEGLANLEHLDLSSPKLTDESLRLLAERCKKLNWLNIGSERFTDAGVLHLGKATNLKMLWLRSRLLSNKSIRHIKQLSQLQHLELTVPSVNDDDVQVLANFRELEILALRTPALTDQQFAMFRNHPRLKSAFINGSQLSHGEMMKVIQSIPNLEHLEVGGNAALQSQVSEALARKRASR